MVINLLWFDIPPPVKISDTVSMLEFYTFLYFYGKKGRTLQVLAGDECSTVVWGIVPKRLFPLRKVSTTVRSSS